MIRIENLGKTFVSGHQTQVALSDINLTIAKGEIFGVIGRSGAGKSTLIRTLNLLERPTSGRVLIEGQDLTELPASDLPAVRQRLGMVFQHFNLLNAKTVAGNIAFALRLTGKLSREAIDNRVAELLDLVGLSDFGERYPHQLSGGQKQRVGIARALANRPSVLLSDEATSALDPETTLSILNLLQDINHKLGLTIVLITHEMSVIRNLCDRVAVLERGRVVESGAVTDVFLHPAHVVTQSLLAESGLYSDASLAELRRNPAGALLRLTFVGEATYEPVLSLATEQTGLHFNILQGTVGRIKQIPYGQLLVETVAGVAELDQVLRFFSQHNIRHEVLA